MLYSLILCSEVYQLYISYFSLKMRIFSGNKGSPENTQDKVRSHLGDNLKEDRCRNKESKCDVVTTIFKVEHGLGSG